MTYQSASLLALYNSRGEVLLQHRPSDACTLPGYWGFFGGDKEPHETVFEALEREIHEELEYRVSNPRLVAIREICHSKADSLKLIFAEPYDESQNLRLHEGQGMEWFPINKLRGLRMAEDDRLVAQQVLSSVAV